MKKVILVLLSLFALSAIGKAEATVGFERGQESVLVNKDSTYTVAWTTGSHYFTPGQCSVSVLSKKFSAKGDSYFKGIVGKGFMNRSIFGYSRFTSTVSFDKSFIAGISPSSVKPVSISVSCSNDKGEADSGTLVVNLIKKAYLSISPSGSVTIKRNEDLSVAANWGEESVRNCSYEISNYEGSDGGILVGGKFPVSGSKIKGESARLNLRCWQRPGDEKESASVIINVVDKPRIGMGDLRRLDSYDSDNSSLSVPELNPDQYADGFGIPNPESFKSSAELSESFEADTSTPVGKTESEPVEKKSPVAAGGGEDSRDDSVKTASDCVCGKTASGECVTYPIHNKKCVDNYLVDYYYCPNKMPDEVAIKGNSDYPKKIIENAAVCNSSNKDRVSDCDPCGRGSDGKCIVPTNNKKCAGGWLVDYYYCPNKGENSPIEGDPLYAKTFSANNGSCQEKFEKEINPTCLPCGADSGGNCVKPTRYERCSANEEHRGERAVFYACSNQPNPLDNPLLNNSQYSVGYVKDSSCSSLYKLNTSAPASPVTGSPSGSGQSSGGNAESKPSAGTPSPSAPACDSPCGKDLNGRCVAPTRYNRCSANEEFKRAYFYACSNQPNPLDNPILGNSSYRVTYEKDSSCSRPYIPGSGGPPSTPTPSGGGTSPSGGSGSQIPSGGTTPSTDNTNNPTTPTAPAVSAPEVIDCSTCSQCGCNSDKTACVQPVTKSRCSNNYPGLWATFQTCPGTDTPAPGTSPGYAPDPVRCPTNKATPAFRATSKFFGSIIGSISGLLSSWR